MLDVGRRRDGLEKLRCRKWTQKRGSREGRARQCRFKGPLSQPILYHSMARSTRGGNGNGLISGDPGIESLGTAASATALWTSATVSPVIHPCPCTAVETRALTPGPQTKLVVSTDDDYSGARWRSGDGGPSRLAVSGEVVERGQTRPGSKKMRG